MTAFAWRINVGRPTLPSKSSVDPFSHGRTTRLERPLGGRKFVSILSGDDLKACPDFEHHMEGLPGHDDAR